MKFKLKALAVATAFALSAGVANAGSINVSTTNATTNDYAGGSDLIFFAWTSGKSFVQDLGISIANFLPASSAANTSQSFTADGAYSSFLTAATSAGSQGSIKWGVVAVRTDNLSNGLGDSYAAVTERIGTTAAQLAAQKSNNVTGMGNPFDVFANATTATAYYQGNPTDDNWSKALKSNFASKLAFNADNAVGTNGISFILLDSVGATTATPQETAFAGTWGFDGSTVSYTVAAVPEPETYGMLAAGLLMLGAIARRRKV